MDAKVTGEVDQVIVPLYWVLEKDVPGVAPVTGDVIPVMAAVEIVAAVVANAPVVTTPELIGFVVVAPAMLKKFADTPLNVNPDVGVRVIVAV